MKGLGESPGHCRSFPIVKSFAITAISPHLAPGAPSGPGGHRANDKADRALRARCSGQQSSSIAARRAGMYIINRACQPNPRARHGTHWHRGPGRAWRCLPVSTLRSCHNVIPLARLPPLYQALSWPPSFWLLQHQQFPVPDCCRGSAHRQRMPDKAAPAPAGAARGDAPPDERGKVAAGGDADAQAKGGDGAGDESKKRERDPAHEPEGGVDAKKGGGAGPETKVRRARLGMPRFALAADLESDHIETGAAAQKPKVDSENVSDDVLRKRVEEIISSSNKDELTVKKVRNMLESEFNGACRLRQRGGCAALHMCAWALEGPNATRV